MSLRPARGAIATGLTGAALVLGALAVGSPPLLVPGLGLLLLAILLPLAALRSARGTTVERIVTRTRVQEDEPLEVVLRVNRRRWDLALAQLHDPLAAPDWAGVPVPAGGELRATVHLDRRGRQRLPPPEVTVVDPLGLVRLRASSPAADDEVLVMPRIEPVRWVGGRPGAGEAAANAGGPHAADPIGAGDLDGLRPYRHGAPASRIHWAALASGAGLMERRLRPDGDGWPLVVLDGRGTPGGPELDSLVRAAASLVVALARRGGVRVTLPGERRALAVAPDLSAWPAVHARLALLDGGAARRAPNLAGAASAGVVLYIAARTPARPPALRGLSQVVLVLPVGAPGPGGRTVLTMGAFRGYDVRTALAGAA